MKQNPDRIKQECKKKFDHTGTQQLIIIFAILGFSNIIALVLMMIYFSFERFGIVPFMSLIYIDDLSEGENFILFICTIIVSVFLGLLIGYWIFRLYQQKSCEHRASLDTEINRLTND